MRAAARYSSSGGHRRQRVTHLPGGEMRGWARVGPTCELGSGCGLSRGFVTRCTHASPLRTCSARQRPAEPLASPSELRPSGLPPCELPPPSLLLPPPPSLLLLLPPPPLPLPRRPRPRPRPCPNPGAPSLALSSSSRLPLWLKMRRTPASNRSLIAGLGRHHALSSAAAKSSAPHRRSKRDVM